MVRKKKEDEEADEQEEGAEETADKSDYDYLLGMNLWSLTHEKVEEIKKQLKIKEEELKDLKKTTVEQFWDRDLDALSAMLDELDLQDDKDAEAAAAFAEGRRKKNAGKRGSAPPPAPAKKRAVSREENKMLAAPLVENTQFGEVQKSVSGSGEGGPTRFSAADIPLEDQEKVSRNPDIIQRPAKAPRVRRAATAKEDSPQQESQVSPAKEEAAEGSGAGLLARLLAGRSSTSSITGSSGSHSSLSTGADFFFGSSSSLFSSGLPEPEPNDADGDGDGGTEPPAKKKKAGKKKKGDDDDA